MTGPIIGFEDKGGQVFNVKAYGATGNGTTDDTTAIQAAITAATPNGIVFFPGTPFKFSALTIPGTVILQGSGWRCNVQETFGNSVWPFGAGVYGGAVTGTVLYSTATSGIALEIEPSPSPGERPCLRDIAFVGPGSGTSIGIQIGGGSNGISGVHLDSVFVANFATDISTYSEDSQYDNCEVQGAAVGLALQNGCNNNLFNSLMVQATSTYGVEILTEANYNQFNAPLFQSNHGLSLEDDGIGNTFINDYYENPLGIGGFVVAGVTAAAGGGMHFGTYTSGTDPCTIGNSAGTSTSHNTIIAFPHMGAELIVSGIGVSGVFMGNTIGLTYTNGALAQYQTIYFNGSSDTGWTGFTFANGWANYSSPTYVAGRYRKINGVVYVEGCLSGSAATGTTITTLPAGYRPSGIGLQMPVSLYTGSFVTGYVGVTSVGVLSISTDTSVSLAYLNFSFFADA